MKKSVIILSSVSFLLGAWLMACKKEETKLPAIGGFNTADEVAAANLVAYWGFESNTNESKLGLKAAKEQGVSYVTGIKGKALKLDNGFVAYPEIPIAAAIQSASVSSWVQVENNGAFASVFFSLTRPNEWAGNFNVMAETAWKKAGIDSLTVKGLLVTKVAGNDSWQDSRNEISKGGVQANKVAGSKLFHLVVTYDASNSNFKVYVNGVKVSNPEWEVRGGGTLGPLVFASPTRPIIGAFGTVADGTATEAWQKPLIGQVDELRVYSKALSDAEIAALYQLELAGR